MALSSIPVKTVDSQRYFLIDQTILVSVHRGQEDFEELDMALQAAGDTPNDPKMGSFGSFRAVRGLALLPNIKPFIPLLLPASCCGALRPKTPIKNGYFWVFLAGFWAFKIGY